MRRGRSVRFGHLAVAAALLFVTGDLVACNSARDSAGTSTAAQDASTVPSTPAPTPDSRPEPKPSRPHPSVAPPPSPRPHDRNSPIGDRNSPRVVPETAPPTDDQLLDSALGKLRKGNLAYSTPDKMKAGKTAHVVARIAGDTVSIDTLKSNLPAEPDAKVEVAATPISTRMKMTLKGADFDITPLSSEEQIVAGDTPTQWQWDIVPKHSGTLRLHLAAVVEINNLSRDFTTVDRDIAVQVDPVDQITGFISKNWQWLIATVTAIVGAAWKYFTSRKNKVSTAPSA